jgi:uncharacterized protein (DUF58 family)
MKFLQDDFIASLDKFSLRAKLIVEGFMIGLHRSPYHGFSVEFSDHRQYNPGDSLRNLDWKIFAKTNRYYIKRYEEETNLKGYILLDHSRSMSFSSQKINKLEYAKAFASALSYMMINQQDAVSLLSFTNKTTNYLPPRANRKYLDIIFQNIYNLEASEQTNTASVLHSLAERIKKRGLIILISDLIDDPDKILSGLKHFRHAKHEVIVFHIEDQQERDFNYKHETEFIDAETGEKVTVSPWQIRKKYRQKYTENREYIKNRCHDMRIEYNLINTNTPFKDNLLQYMIKRTKLM